MIYALVLAPLWDPTGWQRVADQTLHYAVPGLAVVGYLLFVPGPRFSSGALWRSVLIPLTWVVYTLIRSPFISYSRDGETIGLVCRWCRVSLPTSVFGAAVHEDPQHRELLVFDHRS